MIENGQGVGSDMSTHIINETIKNTQKKKAAVLKGDYLSLSPKIHTAGYEAIGKTDLFEYSERTRTLEDLPSEIAEYKNPENNYTGISVGAPFKKAVMEHLDEIDEAATQIGAVNTIVVDTKDGKTILRGTNTDWIGFVDAVKEFGEIEGKNIAIIGAGGAARASIFGALKEKPLEITVFNRTPERAQALAEEFGVKVGSESEKADLSQFDIVVNATSVGMHGEEPYVPTQHIRPGQIVVEWDYSRDLPETQLEKKAKELGAVVVPGRMILLHQAKDQFSQFTKTERNDVPTGAMREVIYGKAA